MDGEHAGLLRRASDSLSFEYDDDYRRTDGATPVSQRLPLTLGRHPTAKVRPYIEGLLPDSAPVRARWAQEFKTSDNVFDLLCHVGEDCAGAVQFVREARLDQLGHGGVDWLGAAAIGAWIERLRVDPAGWLHEHEVGQFSLAGAQSKFALLSEGRRWGRPSGVIPTTHIFKPASATFADHEVNEHLSLTLARRVGLNAAGSEVREFAGRRVVVIERYDRVRVGDRTSTVPTRRGPGGLDGKRLRLAMSLSGEAKLSEIRRRDWEALFVAAGLDPTDWIDRAMRLMARIEAELERVVASVAERTAGPMPERFATCITSALSLRRAVLDKRPAQGRRR